MYSGILIKKALPILGGLDYKLVVNLFLDKYSTGFDSVTLKVN